MSDGRSHEEPKRPASPAGGPDETRDRRFLALGLLVVAVLFSGVVMGVMAAAHFVEEGDPPPDSATTQELRALLRKHPESQEIRNALRAEDERLRRAYFSRRRLIAAGAFLLLGGLVCALACARWYASLDRASPMPKSPAERADEERWRRTRKRSLAAVVAVAGGLCVALLIMTLVGGGSFPRPGPAGPAAAAEREDEAQGEEQPALEVAAPLPQPAEEARFKEHWPRFRGPTGTGIVGAGDWPRSWDAASGENILWKAPVPRPGQSSPVIWGNRIFLTGADARAREVFCFERAGGGLLWRSPVPAAATRSGSDEEEPVQVMDQTGYAAPTPATDGQRVYAFFATADVAAFGFDGRLLWARNLGDPENVYGIATSPIVYGEVLILQFDRGSMAEDGLSALVALDAKTGREAWRAERPVPNSWSTPLLAQTETGPELITSASPWVTAYDPDLGTELWRAEVLSGDVAPSPVFADGMVFVTNEYARVAAIRTGGIGEVTATNVAWTAEEGMSDAASPLCDGSLFLQAHSSGLVTCYDARQGSLLWEHQFDCAFWASPTLVGRLVYLPGEDGKTYLFELSEKFEPVGAADLGEPIYATPAFADSQIYMRGKDHLFCIGKR